MKTLSKCLVYLTMILVSVSPLSACAYSGGPLDGYVLEERTNKPIPGAIVVVRWQGTAFSFVDTHTVCMHVESATTDDQGRYHIASWRKSAEPVGVRNLEPIVTAHKAGYEWSSVFSENVQYLKPRTGSVDVRLIYLLRVSSATRCGEAKASEKNLLPLKKALYQEASAIASTPEDKEKAETLLFGLESLEFGSVEALNRTIERRQTQK